MKASISQGLKNLPGLQGEQFAKLMSGCSMSVEVYARSEERRVGKEC